MQFDPYHTWLGIPPDEQPPNHYRLLGLREYEASGDVIAHAADRQMTYVRTLQSGKYGEYSQQILNEIAAARVCLLNAEKKAEYDAQLKARQRPAASVVEPPARIVPPPVPHSGRVHESQVQSRPPIPPPSGRGERRGQEQPLPGPPRVPSRQTGEVPLAGPGEAAYSATTEPPGASPSAGTGQHAADRPGGSSSQYNVLPGAAARSHAGPPPVPVGASHSAAQDRDNAFAPSEPGNEYSQFSMPADSALAAAEILGAAGSRPLPFGQSAAPGYVSSADGLEKLRLPVEQAPQAANSSTSPRNKKSRWLPLALIGGGLALALAALLAAGIAAAVLMNRSDGKPSADIASSSDATRGEADLATPAKDASASDAAGDSTAGEHSGTSGEGGADSIAADGSVFEADPPIAAAAVENGTAETTQTPGSESVVVSADDPFSVPATNVDVAAAGAGSTDAGAGDSSGTAAGGAAGGGAESSTLAATTGPVSKATSSPGKSTGTRANPPDKVTATTRPPAEPSVERPVSPLGIGAIYSGPKHAVPSGAEARKANELKRELMREADKINARDLKARLLHAEELLRRGQSEKDPVKQYATLEIAYDRALKLNLYPLAKQALRDITTRYDVDELQRRIDFVKQLARKARNPIELNALVIDTMQLTDEAIDAEKFDEAEALCGMAKDLAEKAGNAAKMREARQKQSHVGEARRAATLRRAKSKKKAAKKRP